MSGKLETLLREWGEFNLRHMDHANEWGSNILHQQGILGGRVQDKGDGHNILDVETPQQFRRVDKALRIIDSDAALAIKVYYCCPLKDNGLVYSKKELGKLMSLSEAAFDMVLRRGRRQLRVIL